MVDEGWCGRRGLVVVDDDRFYDDPARTIGLSFQFFDRILDNGCRQSFSLVLVGTEEDFGHFTVNLVL